VVLFLSVLPSLKKAFQESRIDVVCGSWSRELLESHPMIGTIYTYDQFMLNRSGGLPVRLLKNFSDLFTIVSRLRSEKYELGLDLRAYFPNFIPVMALGGVEHKIGFSTGGFGFLLDRSVHWREDVHETEHFMDLFKVLIRHPSVGAVDFSYLIKPGMSQNVAAIYGIPDSSKVVIIHPGSPNKVKHWKTSEWRKLIQHFEEKQYCVLCTGSDGEQGLVGAVVEGSGALDLSGKTSLPALYALIKRAEQVFGVDSFVTHFSSAMGVKTTVIFNGIENISQWRPQGGHVSVITKQVPCSPCYLKNGCESMECLDSSLT